MNRRNTNWMAIMAGASVLCSAAWVFAEEAVAPAAGGAAVPAAEPKAEAKPEAVGPRAETPLERFASLSREAQELQRTIKAKETDLQTGKPDVQKKLNAADEKIKALQAEMIAAQESRRNVFSEADPELKPLYERLAEIMLQRRSFFQRPPTGELKGNPGAAPAVTPHVHTEVAPAPAAK